jgi:D-mannonate dehydratase
MACHPHDPGVPPEGYQGVVRVLGTVDGLKRFITIKESPYHGLNFCQGTVSEMLNDPGQEIYEVIRYFGSRQKIFNVHFRNIRGRRDDFQEVYPDEGDIDFVKALRVYVEVGYPYLLMPDHVPVAANDPRGIAVICILLRLHSRPASGGGPNGVRYGVRVKGRSVDRGDLEQNSSSAGVLLTESVSWPRSESRAV